MHLAGFQRFLFLADLGTVIQLDTGRSSTKVSKLKPRPQKLTFFGCGELTISGHHDSASRPTDGSKIQEVSRLPGPDISVPDNPITAISRN